MRLIIKCSYISVFVLLLLKINFAQKNSPATLTLESALQKAINNYPELQAMKLEIEALKSAKLQSGLSPNPEFEIEAENIFGKDELKGLSGSEITAKVSQSILLAGKLSKSKKVAESNITLAEWDYRIKKLELIQAVKQAYQQAQSAVLLIAKNEELIEISNELIDNLKKRVDAGKISHAEVSRAKIIFNSQQIELSRLQSNYALAISELESLICEPGLKIEKLTDTLGEQIDIPGYDFLLPQLANNPRLKKFDSEYEKQNALLDLENSISVPDLTLSAGYKRSNDIGANTFLIGASIPIPLFNRNQGTIQETKIRSEQKKREYSSLKNSMELRLTLLYQRFTTLVKISEQLKSVSIPQAEEAFSITRKGNQLGRYAIIDVLDAEQTLFDLQNQHINIITEIHSIKIEIEGLIAKEIN